MRRSHYQDTTALSTHKVIAILILIHRMARVANETGFVVPRNGSNRWPPHVELGKAHEDIIVPVDIIVADNTVVALADTIVTDSIILADMDS